MRISSSSLLEVFHAGEWRGVCDDSFSQAAAEVACRQLGQSYVSFAGGQTGSRGFWLDDVVCSGSEAGIGQCQHAAWGFHNCGAQEYVSLHCQ